MIHQCETPYCTRQAVETVDDTFYCEFCAIEARDEIVEVGRHEALFDAAAQIKKEIGE